MASNIEQFHKEISRLSDDQVKQAGSRYTPGLDPNAPNLKIDSLLTAMENAACGARARDRFLAFVDELSEAWSNAKFCSQRREETQELIDGARRVLPELVAQLRAKRLSAATEWIERLTEIERGLKIDLDHWLREKSNVVTPSSKLSYSTESPRIQGNIDSLERCLISVREEKEYTDLPAFKVLANPFLLVTGEWGTGKTHLLCDITRERAQRGLATILLLAKNFDGEVVTNVCRRIDVGLPPESVFDHLHLLADTLGERALVVVDGVNEGNRRDWRDAISKLCALVASRSNIALILSCRTPFEEVAIPTSERSRFLQVEHHGFDDQEFDAQAEFFRYYGLPLPEVPLLDREFSRPLTLKLICESLSDLSTEKFRQGFEGIASGQKGMTFVLESFVKRIGKPIEQQFGLRPKGCWLLLKGNNQVAKVTEAGFAACMAERHRGYVLRSEADRIVHANYPALARTQRVALIEALRTSGLIDEDVVWYGSGSVAKHRTVFRLPYQRFSDHLVARHLLEAHLDTSSLQGIKRSLLTNAPLGRVFKLQRGFTREFVEPGWAEALITEFPERAVKLVGSERRELFFFLPRASQNPSAYFEPFVSGLFWRAPSAFTEGTKLLVDHYLSSKSRAWDRVVDALVAVSTKPKHPYHASRLYAYIARMTMPERDIKWSEYLRRKHDSPTIERLLTWTRSMDDTPVSHAVTQELIVLLSLVLTTVVRNERDVATKALVVLGERYPKALFEHTSVALSFNDPYVSERMLAASYGVSMSLIDSNERSEFLPVLGAFAGVLYKEMFAMNARHATPHCLTRDYALGTIELALSNKCVTLPAEAANNLKKPYPGISSRFVMDPLDPSVIQEDIGDPIHMDFGNYTIGRLVKGRSNYDDKHPDYISVRKRIERRIQELGYRKSLFKEIDRDIANRSLRSNEEHKQDRYGKKYSWIAYFEMYGERDATGKLPGWRLDQRSSDCDLDPSFPKRPPAWQAPIPDLFGERALDTETWVASRFTPRWSSLLVVAEIDQHPGPWVLLDGYVCGRNQTLNREIFALLRGLFVAAKDIPRLEFEFLSKEYPGNSAIPDGAAENYLYAGEVGRRKRYARHLLMPSGKYRRQLDFVFAEYAPAHAAATSGVPVELPTMSFEWESYHSAQNTFSGFFLPAPRLIQLLQLASRNRELDFYDPTGAAAIIYREGGHEWKGDRHRLIYMRADLLQVYLANTRQRLSWCMWGERDWTEKMDGLSVKRNDARQRVFSKHEHIHRSFKVWNS